jgi:hypothetical protein
MNKQQQCPQYLAIRKLCGGRPLIVSFILLYIMYHMTVVHQLSTLLEKQSSTSGSGNKIVVVVGRPQSQRNDDQSSKTTRTIKKKNAAHPSVSKVIKNTTTDSLLPFITYEETTFDFLKQSMDDGNATVGQYLLDYAIVGFPKCGTTTMMIWLGIHREISCLKFENMALQRNHPARLLKFIIRDLPVGRFLRGYKSPNDIEDQRAVNKLGLHYPQTKLIVGLRHPVKWFQSFYNHRIQNGMDMPPVEDMKMMCAGGYHGVCIGRSAYHANLVRLGKTPLGYGDKDASTQQRRNEEWNVFSQKEQKTLKNDLPVQQPTPNPIFLYDTDQLKEGDENYSTFVDDLKHYLGVTYDFPPMIQNSPGNRDITEEEQRKRNSRKIDICDSRYKQQRQLLVDSGRRSSKWILEYFLKSPDVHVGNRQHFVSTMESYSIDPCDDDVK